MRKNSGSTAQGLPANTEGAPVPRSRNKEGSTANQVNSAANSKKGVTPVNPLSGSQTPAVGGPQNLTGGAGGGQNATQTSQNENDTFNKHYNKELRVSKDEIPIVLAELNDSAYRFIKREQYERALNLLQKAYGIMDVIDFKSCRRDKFHLFVMFHNMALCYQKMQMLEECASCIDQALDNLTMDNLNLEERSISNRMRKLVIITRLKMQFCAILSQIHRHKDALEQAREGVRLGHLLINDLRELCLFIIRREDIGNSNQMNNFYSQDLVQGAYEQQQPKDDNLAGNNFNSNQPLPRGGSSLGGRTAGQRNRSFSSFLSQQEAYGAYESLNANVQDMSKVVGAGGANANNVSAMSRVSSHNLSSFYSANQLESSMSYIEKTARKLFPILSELKKRMVPEKKRITSSASNPGRRKSQQPKKYGNASVLTLDAVDDDLESDDEQLFIDLSTERQGINPTGQKNNTDMKNILGYLNQGEWTSKLSIGSIMQLQPYKIKDLIEQGQNELELTRESFIQKVSSLAVSYFCYSTEIRFIIQMKEDTSFDTPTKQKESEFWHAKSLELACTFLPGECPLLNHINLSYQKHFAPVKTTIMEDAQQEDDLMVIKPLNGVENTKVQPIIRRLSNVQVAITPFQLTPINQVTKQVLSQMISFNEYQENIHNHSSAVGHNILPASLVRATPPLPNQQHHQSVSHIPSDNLDHMRHSQKQHSMSVHEKEQRRDNSINEVDSFLNDMGGNQHESRLSHKNQNHGDDIDALDNLLKKLIDSKKITKKQLMQKLLSVSDNRGSGDTNMLDQIADSQDMGIAAENILDADSETDAQMQQQRAMPPRDSSHRNQISSTNSNFYKFGGQNGGELQQMKNERPKSSKGGARSSIQNKVASSQAIHHRSNANVKAQQLGMSNKDRTDSAKDGKSSSLSMIHQQSAFGTNTHGRGSKKVDGHMLNNMASNANESKISSSKHVSKGTKKDVRPLSGGISQKQFTKHESRSRAQNQHHNLSMFDKIGGKNIQQSPPGPIDFHGKSLANHHLKPVGKIAHNQSFDSIQVHNQLASHQGQHGSKLNRGVVDQQSKLIASGQSNIKNVPHVSHHSSTHANLQSVNQNAPNNVPNGQNPQAYDELKKRLLNEYKKLVSTKKGGSSSQAVQDERDHGRNMQVMHKSAGNPTKSAGGVKKHSSRVAAAQQQNSTSMAHQSAQQQQQNNGQMGDLANVNGLSQQHINLIQSQSNQALIDNTIGQTGSPKAAAAHLNVYKPTFIINNSFQNEHGNEEIGRPTDLNKKYGRPSNKTPQTQATGAISGSNNPTSGVSNMQPHHGKSSAFVQNTNTSVTTGGITQSRLKKNSGIDRSSSSVSGLPSGKIIGHGGSKATSSKLDHGVSSNKHLSQQQRELSQQYLSDKQGSSSLNMNNSSKHTAQSNGYQNSYLAAQHSHGMAGEMSGPRGSSGADFASGSRSIDHHTKQGSYVQSHQLFNKPSVSSNSNSSKMVQPRRQNVSAGGQGIGSLGAHHSGMSMQSSNQGPSTSHGTRGGVTYDKLKKKIGQRP